MFWTGSRGPPEAAMNASGPDSEAIFHAAEVETLLRETRGAKKE
jgi:hypothetical protein